MTDQEAFAPKINIGVDGCGDPFLQLDIVTPAGTMLTADVADQLALKIVAAAAAARVRAGVVRDQMLAGTPAQDAVHFVNGLFGTPEQ